MKNAEKTYIASFDAIVSIYADYTPEEINADEDLTFQVERAAEIIASSEINGDAVSIQNEEVGTMTRPVFHSVEQVIEWGKENGYIA